MTRADGDAWNNGILANESTPLRYSVNGRRRRATSNATRQYWRECRSRIPRISTFLLVIFGSFFALILLAVRLRNDQSSALQFGLVASLARVTSCNTCFALLLPLQQLARLGDGPFSSTISAVCTTFRLQPPDVCAGAVERQAPVLAHVLRSIQPNRRGAAALCRRMFGFCSNDYSSELEDWPRQHIPPLNYSKHHLSSLSSRKRQARTGKHVQVIHITDLHIDRLYTVGSEAKCNKPICCRADSATAKAPFAAKTHAGPFGHQACDSPQSLVRSMLDAIREIAPDASFAINTGDIPAHDVWMETQETVGSSVSDAYALLRGALKMPIFGAIGNHDMFPTNLFPRSSTPDAYRRSQWLYETHYNTWQHWIHDSTHRDEFIEHVGCYAHIKKDLNLMIISLNTNFWQGENWYMYDTDEEILDPEGILQYLVSQLSYAEQHSLSAIIIGHTAAHNSFPAQSRLYDEILSRFRDTVTAQFFGDTHMSTFEISYTPFWNITADTASGISITSGAVTPFGGFANPGFRVYEIDTGSGEVWDWHDYATNISDPIFQSGPKWELLYKARETYLPFLPVAEQPIYKQEPLTPAFWHTLADAYDANRDAFRTYIAHKYRSSNFGLRQACRSETCRKGTICAMRRVRSEYFCFRDPDESPHIGDAVVPQPVSILDVDHSELGAAASDSFDLFDILQAASREMQAGGSTAISMVNSAIENAKQSQ